MNAIRLLGLSVLLLLGGCLEATDSVTGYLHARADYCVLPPDSVVLCPEKPPRKPIFPRAARARVAAGAATK